MKMYLSASEATFSQWGAIQIQLPFTFLTCSASHTIRLRAHFIVVKFN